MKHLTKEIKKEREEVVRSMHTLILELNNEDAYEEWISVAVPDCPNPDCPNDEDYEFIAEDEDCFVTTVNAFKRIWKTYISDGLYIGKDVY